uniref:nuclease-related domain-containing protein n=1 Tax=Parolsenella massiliensis TaxID=1871022 RepID=UPI0009345A26|nr:nuclease-related domain-containing protein [Parolsenella massiliensis]
MGKTVKKLHSQRRHHERVAVSVLPEAREQVYARVYKGVSVECVCGEMVALGKLPPERGPFRCPHCGASLSEETFDARAHELEAEIADSNAVLTRHEELGERLAGCGRGVHDLLRRAGARVQLLLGRRRYERATRTRKNACSLLGQTAQARYYAGEWYRATGIPHVSAPGVEDGARHHLKLRYANGSFVAVPADWRSQSRGVAGEFLAFEELRRRTLDKASPLFGARLAANLFVPASKFGRPVAGYGGASAPLWRQIDTVLIAREGVFVVEVKNKHAKVIAPADFEWLAEEPAGGGVRRSTCWVLHQCADQADSLADAIDDLALDDVYEVSAFVRPLGFEGGSEEFCSNVFVGTCGAGDAHDIVGAIEREVAKLREEGHEALSPERVDELADALALRYGDLRRGKAKRHVARLCEAAEERRMPRGRQVYVSNCH